MSGIFDDNRVMGKILQEAMDKFTVKAADKRLEPLHDYIVFRAVLDDRTEGGIVIPEKSQGMRKKALVIAVGPGRYDRGQLVPMAIKPGDVVLLAAHSDSYNATDATGEDLHMCREEDVIAKIHDESLQ